MYAVRDHARVSVKSANTVGKSFDVSVVALWFLMSYYPSKVITTAPTFTQVQEIIWKEIANLYHKSIQPIGAELLKTELRFNDEWFALGISTNEVNRFQGFHSPHLLVIIDEALGVAPEIWEAIEGLHPYRILAIGNPLSAEGEFYNCFYSPLWHNITINAQECVDWQNQHGVIPGLVTQQWIDERKAEWGEKSALYQARVLGEFPEEGTDILIPLKYVERARNIKIDEEEDAIKIVSSDIATKHGENYSVMGYRVGHTLVDVEYWQNFPTTMTTQKIIHKYEIKKADTIVVDSDGVGEGVGDMITDKRIGVLEFHGGRNQKAMEQNRFKNLRTQFYWVVAKKFEKGMYSLRYLPENVYQILKKQLTSIKLKAPDGLGRLQIETKDDMRARGIDSPDFADCFMMSEYAYFCGKMGDIKAYSYR